MVGQRNGKNMINFQRFLNGSSTSGVRAKRILNIRGCLGHPQGGDDVWRGPAGSGPPTEPEVSGDLFTEESSRAAAS